MFEKSLYDLIRGIRYHKGKEREYIQSCLKECRSEIRNQDMDLKATALLKLIYLEMFGHDMSWASFHVLEVMSSAKPHQKRVGYLGAVQSFRPDTEVLMLATNLLKKDLTSSASPPIMSQPLKALPHVITPSLALSVLPDLLPGLSHTNHAIRKKTIVTLYRLALVYPETLRAAWPRIKERLMDKDEHPSVTAAIVNVICELGWRRPHDFLPLAPRLFELLVDGGNNWMAIKLIQLFATLTSLEPRLVRKLLPPLTEIITTTPAMSLLYECIHGIIQGGILGSSDDISGREEIASLCVSKLRGMMVVNRDPNLKYVALLAFNKIVVTHPFLVSQQEDVIMDSIDSDDITIRVKALDLVQGIVNSDNLVSIIGRLVRQLKASFSPPSSDPTAAAGQLLVEDSDEANVELAGASKVALDSLAPLPDDYKADVVGRILVMCSQHNYRNLVDFDWYLDILTQLVRHAPAPVSSEEAADTSSLGGRSSHTAISESIGDEIRNVAVKVYAVRPAAVYAAEQILAQMPLTNILKPVAWVVGEYAQNLASPNDALNSLLQLLPKLQNVEVLATCLQSAIKVFASVVASEQSGWGAERKSRTSLLIARIVHTLEPLSVHPYLEVQERAVEFLELLKLVAEAASGQTPSTEDMDQDAPLLLTQALPSLFQGWELKSIAPGAQSNVPLPNDLDLDEPIHPNLERLLADADVLSLPVQDEMDYLDAYYYEKPPPASISSAYGEPAVKRIANVPEDTARSYQHDNSDESYFDADIAARRRAERLEKNKDDPFYIGETSRIARSSTPIHDILQNQNGADLDIDLIPIMQLDLGKLGSGTASAATQQTPRPRPKQRPHVAIAEDETLGSSGASTPANPDSDKVIPKKKSKPLKQSLLQVDSSHLSSVSLDDPTHPSTVLDLERQKREEAEMAQAMKDVEKLRLEMQRANERIQVAQGVPEEGTVVKRKTKKKEPKKKPVGTRKANEAAGNATASTTAASATAIDLAMGGDAEPGEVKVKKTTKTKAPATATASQRTDNEGTAAKANASTVIPAAATKRVTKKKKAKRVVDLGGGSGEVA